MNFNISRLYSLDLLSWSIDMWAQTWYSIDQTLKPQGTHQMWSHLHNTKKKKKKKKKKNIVEGLHDISYCNFWVTE